MHACVRVCVRSFSCVACCFRVHCRICAHCLCVLGLVVRGPVLSAWGGAPNISLSPRTRSYDGVDIDLTPEEEEMATHFAIVPLDGPQLGSSMAGRFTENFFRDFLKILGPGHRVKSFEKCDFTVSVCVFACVRERESARLREYVCAHARGVAVLLLLLLRSSALLAHWCRGRGAGDSRAPGDAARGEEEVER